MTEKKENSIDVNRIMDMLPHRYPFLMIDKVEDIIPDESAVGVKNVTINEQFFQGHFPGHPIMPGVLIIEAMAQTSGVLVVSTLGKEAEGKLVYFMTIDNVKFRRPTLPGDTLKIHITKTQSRGAVWKFHGEAKIDGVTVAQADFGAMIRDRD